MDQQKAVYPYNGIYYFSVKWIKNWYMDVFWKHYVKWKQPDTKNCFMSIYKMSPGEANLDTKVEYLPWTEVGERD